MIPEIEYYKLASKDLQKLREMAYEMTKSQNTKNEQQKVLCITSEQLTEQWKKDELPSGLYYVKTNGDSVMILGWSKFAGWYNIKEVLASVPSYEEWKKTYECVISENEENARLKELLKECRDVAEFTKTIVNKHKWFDDVITKISQALGEDK